MDGASPCGIQVGKYSEKKSNYFVIGCFEICAFFFRRGVPEQKEYPQVLNPDSTTSYIHVDAVA
jgi:hypothetical protein